MLKRLQLVVVMTLVYASVAMAQITTSGISGKVTSEGEDVIGATVTATHQPSGTVYYAVTNVDGRYTIQGMRPGGPYKVEITYVGHEAKTFDNVSLSLGETQNLSCSLQTDEQLLQEVVVSGRAGLNATKTGAAMSLTSQQIQDMPSIGHGIADVVRLNPQLTTTNSGVMSFAGTNNRYNSFMIDGAANNDVFGLTSSGSNGGQAGTEPVSMETIEQIQVNVAPFDVRQGGFTGGAINAITKSGTNQFHGSVYGFGNNQELIGRKYPLQDGSGYATPYQEQQEYNAGITLGGPIVKDKLFFFANYERTNKQYPNNYGFGSAESSVDMGLAQNVVDMIQDIAQKQGVAYPGVFSGEDIYTRSHKAGLKLDWNINDFNKATVRWSLVAAEQLNNTGGRSSLNDNLYTYPFKSNTNSFIAELQSRISPNVSNEFRASYVRVRDKRDVKSEFPMITVNSVGSGSVNLGIERSSQANSLDQDIYTIEDNLTWYRGNHTFTFGTHNEIFHFSNLFIQDLFGSYYFSSYSDFENYYNAYMAGDPTAGQYINQYRYGHANTDVTGDPRWQASFTAMQLGFYAQDKWDATENFQLTYGLRVDVPIFPDTPAENAPFNAYAAEKGWGVKTNHRLSSSPMWSPRVGFRWDINNDRRFILRGGIGIFTGRIPFVWISNNFSNTGVQLSTYNTYSTNDLTLLLDPNQQSQNEAKLKASGSQTVNVYDKDFKFAQNLRLNLGFDFQVLGINWTAEAIYSKTLNDILYKNLAYEMTGDTYGNTYGYAWDNRPMFTRVTTGTDFTNVYALCNTSKGYTVNLSLKAEKHFDFGLDLMAAYTFGHAYSVNDGTSSVAYSNWKYNYSVDTNSPELSYSLFDRPHKVTAVVSYTTPVYLNGLQTNITLSYTGGSGQRYSYTMNETADFNGDGQKGNSVMYIPTSAEIGQMDWASAGDAAKFEQFIRADKYLSSHRGQWSERYAGTSPFEHHFDLHIAQDFYYDKKHGRKLQFIVDFLNISNLFNREWGLYYSGAYNLQILNVTGVTSDASGNITPTYKFSPDELYLSDFYSRWRCQLGFRLTF